MKHLNCVIVAGLLVGVLAAAAQAKGFFKVGDPAPNFTLQTIDGQTISLAQYKGDRKSTRLNSSHLVISYAVFCLKKKKKTRRRLLSRPHLTLFPRTPCRAP